MSVAGIGEILLKQVNAKRVAEGLPPHPEPEPEPTHYEFTGDFCALVAAPVWALVRVFKRSGKATGGLDTRALVEPPSDAVVAMTLAAPLPDPAERATAMRCRPACQTCALRLPHMPVGGTAQSPLPHTGNAGTR